MSLAFDVVFSDSYSFWLILWMLWEKTGSGLYNLPVFFLSEKSWAGRSIGCWNFYGNLDFHKGSLMCGWLPKSLLSRCSRTMAERGCTSLQATAGFTASTEVFLAVTWCTGGWDFSWVPWYMVLDPITPTEVFFGWMLNFCCREEGRDQNILGLMS